MAAITSAIIGLVGAGLSAAGTASAANSAASTNNAAAGLNYNNDLLNQVVAQQMLDMQKGKNINPLGTTEYREGLGWLSTPSKASQQAINASIAEQLAQLQTDIPLQRTERNAARDMRGEERAVAGGLFDKFQADQNKYSPALIEALMRRGRTNEINQGFDRTEGLGLTQLMRTGVDPSNFIQQLASKRAETLGNAYGGIPLDALKEALGIQSGVDSNTLNQYSTLANRANNYNEVPFTPEQISSTLTSALASRANTSPQAYGVALSQKPQFDVPPPQRYNDLNIAGTNLSGLSNLAFSLANSDLFKQPNTSSPNTSSRVNDDTFMANLNRSMSRSNF